MKRPLLSPTHSRLNQKGMAAIIVTMVTMVVISLIVLGFATISRREQGQTLDQQLSTQAFYAAETGVEDAKNVIMAALQGGKDVPGKTDCDTNTDGMGYTPNYPTGAGTTLDGTHNVSYSCLLVDPTPTSLKYNGVGTDNVVASFKADDTIDKFVITWKPTNAPTGSPSSCPGSTSSTFSPQPKWNCGYGLLRMDLVPTEGALTRAGLASSTLTAFFEPTRNSASGNLSYSGNTAKPNIVAANCGLGAYSECSATIVGLAGQKSFALRLNSLYQPSDLTVTPYHGSTPLEVSGAQAVVDVTGKAQDVLRRIQVRVPVGASGKTAGFAVQSNGALCKRFKATPNYLSIPGDIVNPDLANDMCKAQTYGTPQPSP
jgi:hypothetical protein